MRLVTGKGDDTIYFHPRSSEFGVWKDKGGSDTLALADYDVVFDKQFYHDGEALVLDLDGGTLRMPDTAGGRPSIEYLQYLAPAYDTETPDGIRATLEIVIAPQQILGANIAVLGTLGDDDFRAPRHDTPLDGFSEIFGNAGNDSIVLSPTQSYRAFGGDGRDFIRGLGGTDDFIWGGNGHDRLLGKGGDDVIYGDRGADVIRGGAGNDVLYGDGLYMPPRKGFADQIFGGAGDDFIFGGGGGDQLSGGSGRDVFSFFLPMQRLAGPDHITDFNAAEDRLEIDIDTIPGSFRVRVVDGDTLVRFVASSDGYHFKTDIVVLDGVELTKADIQFDVF